MKNKKILIAVIIIISSLPALVLHAGGNEDTPIFQEQDNVVNQSSTSWFEKHRNKILLSVGGAMALGISAYAWRTRNNNSNVDNNRSSSPLQKKYTKLRTEIDTLLSTEGTLAHKVYKAGIGLSDLPPLTKTAGGINNATVAQLQELKALLNNDEKIKEHISEVIKELGKDLWLLEWPNSKGESTGREIGEDALWRADLNTLSLDELITTALPAMALAAIEKTEAALKDAGERSKTKESDIELLNLYEQGTSVTAQNAVEQLKSSTLPPYVILQRAKRLISKLLALNNPKFTQLQEDYQAALKAYKEQYTNATQEGSVCYKLLHKLLHEVGIDILSMLEAIPSEPDTIKTYEDAITKLNTNTTILASEESLMNKAWKQIRALVEKIASLEFPTKDNDVTSFVGKELGEEITQKIPPFWDQKMFDKLTENLPQLANATLRKVEAALTAANERSGKDQNHTLLSDLETPLTVQEALTQLRSKCRNKPFEVLQRAPEIIEALTSISNGTLTSAKDTFKASVGLFYKLTGNDSAYSKAKDAGIPDLPILPGKMLLRTEKDLDLETNISSLLEGIKELKWRNNELEGTAIEAHTRNKIATTVGEFTHTAREIAQAAGKLRNKNEILTQDNENKILTQALDKKSLDALIQAIPQMITAALTVIDDSMKILNEQTGKDESGQYTNQWRSQTIKEAIEDIKDDKTYTALEKSSELIKVIKDCLLRNIRIYGNIS